MAQPMKLTVELVPETSWYSNLRKAMPRAQWDKLRRKVYAEYGHRCGICGAGGRMNCHEVWKYDDDDQTQRLDRFISLCDMCHHVKHIGFAGVLAGEGRLDFEKVVEHFMNVNRCDRATFEEHSREAFAVWRRRSRHRWTVDLGEYRPLTDSTKLPPPPTDEELARQNVLEMRQEAKWARDKAIEEGASENQIRSLSNILLALDVKLRALRAGEESEERYGLEDFM